MTKAKLLALGASVISILLFPSFAQTIAGPGSHGNGSPQPSQATRCVFNEPSNYGFASKQACLAFFDAGGRLWDFVDDFRFLANPTLDRWGFQTWSYTRAPYATPTAGALLTSRATIEGGTRLEWNTDDPTNFNAPLVGIYSNLGIGIMAPGLGGTSPLVSAVEWKAWQAGTYVARVDLRPIDGNPGFSPDIGWRIMRRYASDGTVVVVAGGLIDHISYQRITQTAQLDLAAGDRVYFVIDQGTDPSSVESSYGDTVGFRLTFLRPGQ